jgi:hypothetical protein
VAISVVVCCSNDFDVVKLLESIDHSEVEIIGALTPNPLIEEYFTNRGYRYALTPVGNHGATANAGMALATTDKILLVDSDCVFDSGAVKAVDDALDRSAVVNLPIRFAARDSALSQAIATCRHFDNTYNRAAFKPGIAFRAEVRQLIGGYWYDERICWPCDSELLWRLKQLNVPIEHLDGVAIEHRPISLQHALRAYHAYGRDGWKRVTALRQTTHLYPLSNLAGKSRAILDRSRSEPKVLLNFLFEGAYVAGFLTQAVVNATQGTGG